MTCTLISLSNRFKQWDVLFNDETGQVRKVFWLVWALRVRSLLLNRRKQRILNTFARGKVTLP